MHEARGNTSLKIRTVYLKALTELRGAQRVGFADIRAAGPTKNVLHSSTLQAVKPLQNWLYKDLFSGVQVLKRTAGMLLMAHLPALLPRGGRCFFKAHRPQSLISPEPAKKAHTGTEHSNQKQDRKGMKTQKTTANKNTNGAANANSTKKQDSNQKIELQKGNI